MTQRGLFLLATAAIALGSASGATGAAIHAAKNHAAKNHAASDHAASDHAAKKAHATLKGADGTTLGEVDFRRRGDGTEVTASLRLPQGVSAMDAFHGFHVHANDKPGNGSGCVADPAQPPATWFVSADGHLAAEGQLHGAHTGDMPSVLVNADGTATLEFTDQRLDLADLAGRAVVLHAGPDNFGNIPTGAGAEQYTPNSSAATTKTGATGNAGDRIACGVITAK